MLEPESAVSVGVLGEPGVSAGMISMWVEGFAYPTAFRAITLNLYFWPVVSPVVK